MTTPYRVCGVCGRGLNMYGPSPEQPEGYFHSSPTQDDHPVVPVLPGEVVMNPNCDMCNADMSPDEVWTWPTHDFHPSVGDWALCSGCHELAVNGRWEELTQQVIDAMVDLHGEEARSFIEGALRPLHEGFRRHIYDKPYRGLPIEYVNAHQGGQA